MRPGQLFGQQVAFAELGVSHSQQLKEAATADTLAGVDAEAFHRNTCRFIKMAYEKAGKRTDYGYALFTKLAAAPEWNEAYMRFMKVAYSALGRQFPQGLEKEASGAGALTGLFAADAVGRGMKMGPEVFQMLVAAGLLAGSSAGALHWGAKRHASQDEPELEKLEAKREQYDALTNDINNNLLAKGFQ